MKIIRIIAIVMLVVVVVVFLDLCVGHFIEEIKIEQAGRDCETLRNTIAGAYLGIKADRNFVNTATEGQPMELPDKYYNVVESAQGHGRIHVIVYADGSVDAYFGTPEKTLDYYVYGKRPFAPIKFPFIYNALRQNCPLLKGISHLLCILFIPSAGTAVFFIVRHVKKKNFEATIAALQADTKVDELP